MSHPDSLLDIASDEYGVYFMPDMLYFSLVCRMFEMFIL